MVLPPSSETEYVAWTPYEQNYNIIYNEYARNQMNRYQVTKSISFTTKLSIGNVRYVASIMRRYFGDIFTTGELSLMSSTMRTASPSMDQDRLSNLYATI